MKYLQDYMNKRQSASLRKAGAFFAFGKEQFEKEKQTGVKYSNCGMGMICPSDNVDTLISELNAIYTESIEQDIAENTIEKIVLRELNNHEAYYTRDLQSTADALTDYPVTMEQISALFNNKNYKII